MHPSEYDNIARCAAKHWWYRGLRALVKGEVDRLPEAARAGRWCDVGCGTGHLLGVLPKACPPYALDASPLALRHASRTTPGRITLGSVNALPFAAGSLAGVTLMDVLYHRAVPDKIAALREVSRVVRPGGYLLLNVPAYTWLESNHDRFVMTDKRSTRGEAISLLEQAGFEALRATYWNTLLLPAIAAARMLQAREAPRSDVAETGVLMNVVGTVALALERVWLRYGTLPAGVSIFAVARKPT